MRWNGYVIISFVISLVLLSGCSNSLSGKAVLEAEETLISEVIDGDTVETADGVRIRLLGINTPEINEDYYQEAKDEMKKLVLNRTVLLVKDVQDKDKYDRDLRYAYVDGMFVNAYMVEHGYAKTLSIEPNTKFSEKLALIEREAIDKGVGIWGIEKRNACVVLGCEEGTNYVASKNSKVYHDCSCSKVSRMRFNEVDCFNEIPDGYRLSKLC